MTFAAPWALVGLLAVPILILLDRRRRRPRAVVWPSLLVWRAVGASADPKQRRFDPRLLLECAAAALLALAAAGPGFVAGRAEPVVAVYRESGARVQARLADGRTVDEATGAELARVREALGPGVVWREIAFEGSVPTGDAADLRILASNRADLSETGFLRVARAPEGRNVGFDALVAGDGRVGFAVRGPGPVAVRIDDATRTVQPDTWVEVGPARTLRIETPNVLALDDELRLRPLVLRVRTDAESPLVQAALAVGVPAEVGEPADLVLATRGGAPVDSVVLGAACVAHPGIFDGLFLDDVRWEGARTAEGAGLLSWRGRALAQWRDDGRTLWLGLPVDRAWDEHGTLPLMLERAKRTRARALLEPGETLAGTVAVRPAPGFVETDGIDRPWNGRLPPFAPSAPGRFELRALLAWAAVALLVLLSVRHGR